MISMKEDFLWERERERDSEPPLWEGEKVWAWSKKKKKEKKKTHSLLGFVSVAFRLWEFGCDPIPCAWFPYQQSGWGGFLCICEEDCSGVRCKGFCAVARGPLSLL